MARRLAEVPGIEVAMTNREACRRFELPPERLGDLVVISVEDTAIGSSVERHDLSGLTEPLRTRGFATSMSSHWR